MGLTTIAPDVIPELARATIASVVVLGALRAPPNENPDQVDLTGALPSVRVGRCLTCLFSIAKSLSKAVAPACASARVLNKTRHHLRAVSPSPRTRLICWLAANAGDAARPGRAAIASPTLSIASLDLLDEEYQCPPSSIACPQHHQSEGLNTYAVPLRTRPASVIGFTIVPQSRTPT
jgi:hypothetical protein